MNPEITPLHAIILGLVQGLTEFIPVSSSAHLNITHWLLGHKERELPYDVMLHVGTLVALVWYFRHDWKLLLSDPAHRKLRNLVLLGCVPGAVLGKFLDKFQNETLFADVRFNAVMLLVMGTILLAADRVGRKARPLEALTLKDAMIVGFSQALALIPGVSRSGSTMTAGLFLGFNREAAARFSFLMSLPITLGAVGYKFYKDIWGVYQTGGSEALQNSINASPGVILLGILASGLSGFWAISFLLNFLKRHGMALFFYWRAAVALLVLGTVFLGLKQP
ncbi:MAG TPA: undecaprenyl-diphosphate phosphatase [Abditibacteriaceae bacterium]|jgi:undecaprenyl-diphosphatase